MKARKIRIDEIPTYYAYGRGEWEGKPGYYYYIDGQPSKEVKQGILQRFSNVAWLNARSEYAPEQRKTVLFVANKAIR